MRTHLTSAFLATICPQFDDLRGKKTGHEHRASSRGIVSRTIRGYAAANPKIILMRLRRHSEHMAGQLAATLNLCDIGH